MYVCLKIFFSELLNSATEQKYLSKAEREWQVGDSVANDVAYTHVEQLSHGNDYVVDAGNERRTAASSTSIHSIAARTSTPSTEDRAEYDHDDQVVHHPDDSQPRLNPGLEPVAKTRMRPEHEAEVQRGGGGCGGVGEGKIVHVFQ